MAAGGVAIALAVDLTCRGVVVHPGGQQVLRGVDLHVRAGSLTTLTGPSGVGKTTLLRAIAGLEDVRSGSIVLGDRDLRGTPTHQRDIAYVFQRPRLFPHLDVVDNVGFPLRMKGVEERERRRRASELLDEVDLGGFASRLPRRLSGGEAQRVALARALVGEPDLLLLDEPLARVDPDLRRSLRELISRLLDDRPTTAIYVTHDQAEAAELGDRIAVMLGGVVVQEGPPQELFERPTTLEVARFFGTTNVLAGCVADGQLPFAGSAVPVKGEEGEATFVIRPQHVRLVEPRASAVQGRVIERRYLGTRERVRVEVSDAVVEADLSPGTAPQPGTMTGLALPSEHLWRLPTRDSTRASEAPGSATR
ncbi:MAG: ABC transporter ATP-binding protein [Nitriliruptorales bacterium]|nr:ABC transporter ATP-binding protein [Nitriliruptorales bacterium]